MELFLISFVLGDREWPTAYELIYALNFEEAKEKLKKKYYAHAVRDIENCTIQ